MEKSTILKNISFKKIIPWIAIGLVALLLALLPVITSNEEESDISSVIKNEKAATRDIDTVLIGGGQIESSGVYDLEIPEEVKIKEFLVSNGDTVSEGDPIAVVDTVSAMAAITGIQETIDELADDIEEAEYASSTTYITSSPGGRVKKVYAQVGDSIEDVMLEYGTLAIISLDDTMGVTIEAETSYMPGDKVSVTIGDETVTGRIKTNANNKLTLTVDDNKYEIGEVAEVYDENNKLLGKGMLYVYNQWNATGTVGTISSVYLTENTKVYAGQTLFAVKEPEMNSDYQKALDKMQKYEKLLAETFEIYSKGYVAAPCDGIVSGIDTTEDFMLSYNPESNYGTGSGYRVVLLADEQATKTITVSATFPQGTVGVEYYGWLTAIDNTGASVAGTWACDVLPAGLSLEGSTIHGTPTTVGSTSVAISFTPDGSTTPISVTPTPSITIIQAVTPEQYSVYGAVVTMTAKGYIRVSEQATAQTTVTDYTTLPTTAPDQSTMTVDSAYPTSGSFSVKDLVWIVKDSTGKVVRIAKINSGGGGSGGGGGAGGSGSASGGGSSGGGAGGGMTTTEEGDGLYSQEKVVIATVTSQEEMTVSITIDELDITKVYVGQTATITMNSFAEEPVEAVVTNISNSGENSGGNSKFTVDLKLSKTTEMLPGMNATATITLDSAKNVLSVPSGAIYSLDGKNVVYTSYNKKDNVLEDPVEVEIGVADANYVQILSGLTEDSTVYYEVFETVGFSGPPSSL